MHEVDASDVSYVNLFSLLSYVAYSWDGSRDIPDLPDFTNDPRRHVSTTFSRSGRDSRSNPWEPSRKPSELSVHRSPRNKCHLGFWLKPVQSWSALARIRLLFSPMIDESNVPRWHGIPHYWITEDTKNPLYLLPSIWANGLSWPNARHVGGPVRWFRRNLISARSTSLCISSWARSQYTWNKQRAGRSVGHPRKKPKAKRGTM